ncbi:MULTISPECIES: alpha/beta fold hydrolase [unclassified Gordonia (in: high G+C Gram-positive bacteria)]|uniref:alpha/beta fold hydrolase n=1 Tax=unclassified Gordonia (in: high G+C Gram-positive bacteria) TaxID=2657482 RepID=UPI001F0D4BE2|nr:alpha/beta fold hydrolase [Gordonia sp. ABSL49_1]MCH5645257.1 alpha/beta fold hydrolase [Gordonia sp. ABSL49_1]
MGIDFVPDRNLYPFTSRWFASSAGSVHYIDEGVGPTILFCHGSPTWSFLYRHVVTRLRDRFRCVAVDHLGFGRSERPDNFGYTISELTRVLGEVVDHLDLEGYVLMGHDWGGPIGLGAATARADRVRGIVLANTAFWPITALPNRAFSVVMSSDPARRRILENNLLVERFLLGELGSTLTSAEADQYRFAQPVGAREALAVMPREIRAAGPLLHQLERTVPETLGDKPALALWGMRDMVFRPSSCLPRVRAAFRDIEVVELSGARHFVTESAPEPIAEAIERRFV